MVDVSSEVLAAIRAGLSGLPELAHHVAGRPVAPEQIFFPLRHAMALDPDVTLVVGNRGVGKSFWASALAGAEGRQAINEAYGGFSSRYQVRLEGVTARFGFSGTEAAGDALVSAAQIASVRADTPTVLIWRAVILRALAPVLERDLPSRFADLVDWIRDNPDEQQTLFRDADAVLSRRDDERILILFDQLEQLAEDWTRINDLTRGLLQTALAMKSYSHIRLKIFMRLDQYENISLFQFPDGSKSRGEAVALQWKANDLYALLFFELLRNRQSSEAFKSISNSCRIAWDFVHQWNPVPLVLLTSEEKQRDVFVCIAGEAMGRGKQRGAPYTWIPVHLSDSRGEVTPRSFLKLFKTAADQNSAPSASAIDFNDIKEGVRAASDNRLTQIEEDYPWVTEALEPLRDSQVPAPNQDVLEKWRAAGVVQKIVSRHSGNKAPLDLVVGKPSMGGDDESALLKLLYEIGVLDVRANGKIDVPDIFRIRAGIRRRGGVTPQQRKRL
jgi:hypothetical protein